MNDSNFNLKDGKLVEKLFWLIESSLGVNVIVGFVTEGFAHILFSLPLSLVSYITAHHANMSV